MLKRSILRSSPYKPSKEWTLNPFKVRFYTEWTPVYKFELVIEDLYNETKLPPLALKKLFFDHKMPVETIVFPTHVLQGMESARLAYLENDDQYIQAIPKATIQIAESDTGVTQLKIGHAKNGLIQIPEAQSKDLPVKTVMPNHADVVEYEEMFDSNVLEKINISRSVEIQKVNDSKTYLEALNSVPDRLKIRPFKPTPKHFDLVSFDHVMKDGVGLSEDEIAEKGKHLSVCIWLLLLFVVSFGSMFCMAFLKMVIATFVVGSPQVGYLVAFCYMGAATTLSAVLYLTHQHIYWQYSRNKFGSIYDFLKDVQRHPIRLLPLLFDPDVNGEDYV